MREYTLEPTDVLDLDTLPAGFDQLDWLSPDQRRDQLAREMFGNHHADRFRTPRQQYDAELELTPRYRDSLPDLQNGPSSLIKGAPVTIQQVGIHHFRLPLVYRTRDNGDITLETSVTGTVSLAAHKKGINMSRIMRSFYRYRNQRFSIGDIRHILDAYREDLESFDARIMMKFSYPILQESLRTDNVGYQYYDVVFEGDLSAEGTFTKTMHLDFVYSSACPCSYELSLHAQKYRNRAVVPHSQRSVARVSVRFEDMLWIEDLQEICLDALQTETQVIVKREDEQAFAELNGANLKFVEDAVRLLYDRLNREPRVRDFRVVASHQESLHSHDAVAVIVKGVPEGFRPDVSREELSSLIHVPR